jgi:hypothetical protein
LVDVDGSITGDLNGTVVQTDTQPPFIIRGPIAPGNFLGSGVPALYTDDLKGQESYQPGYRITLGYRFNSGSAIEANYLNMLKVTYAANASLIPPNYANLGANQFLADSFLFAPFFNLPPEFGGPNQELAIGNPGAAYGIFNGAINMSINFQQFFQNFDIRGRVPYFQDECTRMYGYGGGRFAWFWEQFQLRAVGADFAGFSRPEDVAVYSNSVSNRMYGPFAGFGVERYLGCGFGIGLEAEAAYLVDIARAKATLQNGDRPSVVRDTPFVQLKKAVTDFNSVFEFAANAQITWYPTSGIQCRAGYNFMTFLDTLAAQNPIAFDARNFDPDWKSRPTRFLDGFNAGIGFIF